MKKAWRNSSQAKIWRNGGNRLAEYQYRLAWHGEMAESGIVAANKIMAMAA
jgi:predicted ABC-class ATPase